MKKLLWLMLVFVYVFTSSTLVHASTMWFFDIQYDAPVCRADTSSTSHKQPQQIMSCCTSLFVSHYSEAKITIKHIVHFVQNTDVWLHHWYDTHITFQKPSHYSIAFSPWWQTSLNTYNKFSDLFGVVVKII